MNVVFESLDATIYKCQTLVKKRTWFLLFVKGFQRVANFNTCEAAFLYWEKEFKSK